MVLLREVVANRLHLNGIHKLKRVKNLSDDAYSSTSPNVPEHARRSGLFFVSLSIVVITIFSILFLYCFLVEYRLAKIITKMNEFEKRQKVLEDMLERLMPKMENSKHVDNGNLKRPNEIQNTPKRGSASEAHHIKVSSRNLYQSPRLDDKLNNTIIVDNVGTSNADASVTQTEIVSTKIRIRRSKLRKKKKLSERLLTNTSLSSGKRDRTAARFPLIHLENNSTSFREKSEGDSTTFNFWKEADWVNKFTKNNFQFYSSNGHVVVKRSGAYLIYVQVVYHDAIGRWSAGIDVDRKVRAKCLESEQLKDIENYSQENHGVYKQCSISTVIHLLENQSVSIKCMYGYRTILSQPEFTFWGMVKLA